MCRYKKNQPLICFDKRVCKTCKVPKDLNVTNFELRSKLTGRMSLECKPCYRVKVNKRLSAPEQRLYMKQKREAMSEWYKAWHKSEAGRKAAKKLRQKPEHKKLRNALEAKRRAAKIQRTPPWADLKAIEEFYMNRPEDMVVDHIIPLQGENVSGLHVRENLQYLTREENCKKNNKFEGLP